MPRLNRYQFNKEGGSEGGPRQNIYYINASGQTDRCLRRSDERTNIVLTDNSEFSDQTAFHRTQSGQRMLCSYITNVGFTATQFCYMRANVISGI